MSKNKFSKYQLKTALGNDLKIYGWHRSRDGKNVRMLMIVCSPDDKVLGFHVVKFGDNGNRIQLAKHYFDMFLGFLRVRGVDKLSWEVSSPTLIRMVPKIVENFL